MPTTYTRSQLGKASTERLRDMAASASVENPYLYGRSRYDLINAILAKQEGDKPLQADEAVKVEVKTRVVLTGQACNGTSKHQIALSLMDDGRLKIANDADEHEEDAEHFHVRPEHLRAAIDALVPQETT